MKINSISAKQADFPEKLLSIPEPPRQLYFAGQLPEPGRAAVAIVGSRKPTVYGRGITQRIAGQLARRGVIVISGLAFGVDAIAHQAVLEAGGVTIAVLPEDLDHIYPRSHQKLAQTIATSGGALISEHKNKQYTGPWDFLPRNRLVSGLADAVIITEANIRSGTMSTAAHALAQGRDVYAVPGPITSPLSAGCNRLIAQGATPIYDIDEFIDDFTGNQSVQTELNLAFDDDQAVIIDLIKSGLADGDELLEQSGFTAVKFNQVMTMLELQGTIHALGGN
ncbi:MAG TPA: DNA-processing protein DprA, partial [Candidatus Saccharimonadales bacterium]|nr:DNA-processing protein DprA [Candidatus Saccharimonadales bacterium]